MNERTAHLDKDAPFGFCGPIQRLKSLVPSGALARHLLAATGVAAVAGSAFFRPGCGEDLLRFCFAKQDAELDEACARLRKL